MSFLRRILGQPAKSDLHKFCDKLTLERVAFTFEQQPNANGLGVSLSLLYLHQAKSFLDSAIESKHVGDGEGLINANVAIFEAAVFLSNSSLTPIMRWATDERQLDEDSPVCEAIYSSRVLACAFMAKHWPGVSTEELNKLANARTYIGRHNEPASTFADWLVASYGKQLPASTRLGQVDLDIRRVPLDLMCRVFATHMAGATVETAQRQIAAIT